MNKIAFITLACCLGLLFDVSAQSVQSFIYKDRRIINTWSTEVLPKRVLDFRVAHRFGDFSGPAGGWKTFYGLENASDISIGFDYGLLDNVTIGIHRSKGAGPLTQLLNGHVMWRITSRGIEHPSSLGFMAMSTMSTMPKSDNPSSLSHFPKFAHRFLYYAELVGAKKFNNIISGSVGLNIVHHNYVRENNDSNLFSITTGLRLQLSRSFALLAEATYPISVSRNSSDYHFYFLWPLLMKGNSVAKESSFCLISSKPLKAFLSLSSADACDRF